MFFERKHTIAVIARGLAFISALALSPSVAEDTSQFVHAQQVTARYDDDRAVSSPDEPTVAEFYGLPRATRIAGR